MDELYPYYERELAFIREMAAEFAERHPDTAARLDLGRFECTDPHVERLIEAFALLSARVHYRFDAEYPEFTQSLIEVLYPHFLRPVPSMGIAQFAPASGRENDPTPVSIPRGEIVTSRVSVASRPESTVSESERAADQAVCRFQTCYPVTLTPVSVADADYSLPEWARRLKAFPGILLRFKCEVGFSALRGNDTLCLFIRGPGHVPFTLYELLLSKCVRLFLHDPDAQQPPIELGPKAVEPVGFGDEESALPWERRVFQGFRLLQEYFAFPDKFLFVRIRDLGQVAAAGFGSKLDMFIELRRDTAESEQVRSLRGAIGRDNFQLHCSPIVNLFERYAEPIRVDQRKAEYLVQLGGEDRFNTEIYSVNSISSVDPVTGKRRVYQPLHAAATGLLTPQEGAFWRSTRKSSGRLGDSGTDVYLSFADLDFRPSLAPDETLRVRVTCTNRNVPPALPIEYVFGELQLQSDNAQARFLQRPTPPLRMSLRDGLQWKLISHLALNYLSLAPDSLGVNGGSSGRDALHNLLSIYNLSDSAAVRRQLDGITGVSCQPVGVRVLRPPSGGGGPVLLNGHGVSIDFLQEAFRSTGAFVFASVLERFLGLTAPVNSFVQLTATTDGGRRLIHKWPPRAGEQVLR